MATTVATTIKCVRCGKFMDCADPGARCYFEPDNHFGPERVEWTCGICVRNAAPSGGESAARED